MAAATAAPGRDREISGEPDLEDMAPRILVFSLAETPIECRTPVTQISRWIHPARVAARGTSAAPPGLAWPRASGRQRAWEAGHEVEDTDPGRTNGDPSHRQTAQRCDLRLRLLITQGPARGGPWVMSRRRRRSHRCAVCRWLGSPFVRPGSV